MPNASIILPDGTSVVIEGSPEEVAKLLALYGGAMGKAGATPAHVPNRVKRDPAAKTKKGSSAEKAAASDSVDLAAIIETIKNCD